MFKITLRTDDGEVLFDAESIAVSLGITTVAKSGNVCVRWKRVNEYLKNSPEVGKGDFIPEAMVYKLAFKANNETAESFQDWLAIEVLPSIRKTGTYSMKKPEQLKLPEKVYEYKPKYYKGQPVVTYQDLEHFTGIPKSNFNYYMCQNKEMFIYGGDYWYLEGKELACFKRENSYSKYINRITLISKSGFLKLSELMQGSPKELECFQNATVKPLELKPLKNIVTDIPENKKFQDKFAEIRKSLSAIDAIIATMNRYTTETEAEAYKKTALSIAVDAYVHVCRLTEIKYNLVEKAM